MKFKSLLHVYGEKNIESINLTQGGYTCDCTAQTFWHLVKFRSIGLSDHHVNFMVFAVSSILARRWVKKNFTKHRESKLHPKESIHSIGYSRRQELFETTRTAFAVPTVLKRIWSHMRMFSCFRALLTSWLYTLVKNHISKHPKHYGLFFGDIVPVAFNRPLFTRRNRVMTS